ncbi:unnamed protein product [Parascedosporium putredinis]|uniref:Carboxymuconolactone decarboxylase-like domain-containing protein n=1 Tax=Parascedosporium putredinis TaxID=1442378 RepID=A0A9P1H4S0_9PEZI|nr:unnamed protein product [Parascedosporium putredinis]CAI7997032.1 unnamed protein product [Parascedosporium putredinis]
MNASNVAPQDPKTKKAYNPALPPESRILLGALDQTEAIQFDNARYYTALLAPNPFFPASARNHSTTASQQQQQQQRQAKLAMASTTTSDARSSKPGLPELFTTIEKRFADSGIGADYWYIFCTATLVGGNDPELCDQLYLHLIAQPQFSTPEQRQALIRSIREVLVKCVCVVGVCKPLEAIMAINQHERQEDKDFSFTREGWQCDEANLERGMGWMRKIYTRNTDSTLDIFNDHKDFGWISRNITYGLYLSDRQVLDDLGTEIAVLASIMIQNLRKETHWHIRGIRRLGVSSDDVQMIWECVHLLADFWA